MPDGQRLRLSSEKIRQFDLMEAAKAGLIEEGTFALSEYLK
jgi:hypothetical protein